jgi:enoyl-CoA hydratase/carnithine racemase
MNAINREMALNFQDKLGICQTDKSIRCVIY